ncbi:MAG TPA: response regulator transcription factor [Polyangia bacterium]
MHRSHALQLTKNPWTILVLAEELDLGRRLAQALVHPDFRFAVARPVEMANFAGGSATFDLVLLHVGRERAEGPLLREILRKGQSCVVVISRAATGVERATWLEHGADDCLSYPCDSAELWARLRASVRRRPNGGKPSHTLRVGSLVVSPQERTAAIGGRPLSLTTCEFALLAALAERAGQVLSREQLMEIAKGSAELAFERSIDVQVSRLRAKLQDDSRQPQILKTVRGAGYVLVPGKS